MERLYAELSEYYVFDKLKYTLEEFFGDIKTFKDQFKQVFQMFFETCPFSLNQMFAHCTYQPGLRVDAERERIRGEASSSTGGEGEGRQGEVGGEHQCCHC